MGKQGETAIIEMNIEIRNKEVKFENVPIGGLFAYPASSYADWSIYMATDEHCVDGDKVNAVNVYDGNLHEFCDNDDVRIIDNAKLVVE